MTIGIGYEGKQLVGEVKNQGGTSQGAIGDKQMH
jgi:hypothetical protein